MRFVLYLRVLALSDLIFDQLSALFFPLFHVSLEPGYRLLQSFYLIILLFYKLET